MAALPRNSSGRTRARALAAGAALLIGWSGIAASQTMATAGLPAAAIHGQHPKAARANEASPACADDEPAGAAILTALAGGDGAFALLAQENPGEALRCSSFFPGAAATELLRRAALAVPFDAVGAADQLSRRPGGGAIIDAVLRPDVLMPALDSGLPFYETRHELRRRLPAMAVQTLEDRASRALAAAFAKDPVVLSARIGALIDGMADDPPTERFHIVAALSTETLFELIARIGPQLYTSSFDGILDLLATRLKRERRSFLDLAREPGTATLWADFVVAVVSSGRTDTLFGAAAGDARALATGSVRALLSPAHGLDAPIVAGALADAMDTKSDLVRAALEDELAAYHRNAKDPSVKAAAGLAGGLHAGRQAGRPATAAFTAERFAELYPVPAPPALSGPRLFQAGVNVQRMTFYDDLDGKASFSSFLHIYRTRGWTVRNEAGFVVVSSPERRGRRIVIVADVPSAGEKGRAAVRDWLSREKLSPTVVIHRGHSYHEDETMPEIGPATALVFWGSCGGHQRLRATLDQAPDALVLATRNIGVTRVNQALLRTIEERLLADGLIDWSAVWADAQAHIRDPRFPAYRRPDQNSTLIALRAWRAQSEQAQRRDPLRSIADGQVDGQNGVYAASGTLAVSTNATAAGMRAMP